MKKIIYIISSVILISLTSCSSQSYITEDAFNQVINSSEFSFHAKKALPNNLDVMNALSSMPGATYTRIMNLDEGYGFQLKKGEMSSALPYFGRLYNASSYGNRDKAGFTFTSNNITVSKTEGKKGKWIYRITANDQYNTPTYVLEVFKNGQAYLSINSNDRQPISYDGYITVNRED